MRLIMLVAINIFTVDQQIALPYKNGQREDLMEKESAMDGEETMRRSASSASHMVYCTYSREWWFKFFTRISTKSSPSDSLSSFDNRQSVKWSQ